jgi:hypothetical protein
MGWAKVSGGSGAIKGWNTPGETAEGVYTGMRDGKDFGGNRSKITDLTQPDGTAVTIGVPTALRNDLQKVAIGTRVHIEYLGLQRNPRSGREFKAFDTQQDDGKDNAGSGAATAPTSAAKAYGFGAEFDLLAQTLAAAKGAGTADATVAAIKAMESDPAGALARLKATLKAQGVAA